MLFFFHHAIAFARPSAVARPPLQAVTLHDIEKTCFSFGIFAAGIESPTTAASTADAFPSPARFGETEASDFTVLCNFAESPAISSAENVNV